MKPVSLTAVYKWIKAKPCVALVAGGLLLRLLATLLTRGHVTDMNCFAAWAEMLYNDGFKNFYSSDVFTDYPAVYMYVLYVAGFLRNALSLQYNGYAHILLLKLPAILADVGTGVLVYKLAKRRIQTEGRSCALSPVALTAFYMFNPLIIMISSVWGQVDSVYTLLIAVSIYLLTEKRALYAYVLFAIGALVKPQSLMFSPIYLYYAYSHIEEQRFRPRAWLDLFSWLLACAGVCTLLLAPFITAPVISVIKTPGSLFTGWNIKLTPVLAQYVDTLGSYSYCSVNAYNIYGLFGLNWRSLTETFLGINYIAWGVIAVAAITAASIVLLVKSKTKASYFYTAGFIAASVFMLSVKMHERYAFPALLLLLLAYMYSGEKRVAHLYALFSVTVFINCADALRLSLNDNNYDIININIRVFSFFSVAVFVYMAAVTAIIYNKKRAKVQDFTPRPVTFQQTRPPRRYSRREWLCVAALTAVYAAVAFFRLGDASAPETRWSPAVGDTAVFDFGGEVNNLTMLLFNGPRHNKEFVVSVSNDGVTYEYLVQNGELRRFSTDSVFAWHEYYVYRDTGFRYMRVVCNSNELYLMEMAFRDATGAALTPALLSPEAAALLDEQHTVPPSPTYMNGTYFDEIYHPRTAYEFIHGLGVYETSHPPLGKLIIASGVLVFGMNPFGWRFMGTLAGVLMIPLLYAFARRLFGSPRAAFFAAALLALDFMHLTQTRLATIDSFLVLFVMASYFFMYKYYAMSFYDVTFRKTLPPLFLSGLFIGLAAATKWSGMYAALGLAIIFFLSIYKRFREYRAARHRQLQGYAGFHKKMWATLAFCVLFFVVVPLGVYVSSYVPYYFHCKSLYPVREYIPILREQPVLARLFPDNTAGNFLAGVAQNQADMLSYHGGLDAKHPYGSNWWTWALNMVPMWYYSKDFGGGSGAGISAFGNPLIWWCGLAALAYCVWRYFKNRDERLLFIAIAYLAQLMPWMLVTRVVFIYHYFPCVPFLALALAHVADEVWERRGLRHAPWIFLGIALVLFAVFYPVLTGQPVNMQFARTALRWLPRWVLI